MVGLGLLFYVVCLMYVVCCMDYVVSMNDDQGFVAYITVPLLLLLLFT